ncbi:MerR family transcriptional regulator [Streptomyces sp. A7024]|uniref:MerR family transcriptional regulator n=1 Tax=Streptomyces coryli TaxID=1128680 RepID=A0A6G4U4K0_9ACTN|nr:MerR family transcriptional regulator [Streptomyces coryli]NGN67165.1 MerR family transcriptional regulator [Streptomyces coryli]
MSTAEQVPAPEYRIEDLAHVSGATVRTIRAYADRGLLPKPERRGRANVYGEAHLARLRQIAELLDRGYTLVSIKELLEAWDAGRGLRGVLGLVAELDGPWSDEEPSDLTRTELDLLFGGVQDDEAVADAVALGVLERVEDRDDLFRVPSPQQLKVAAELHAAGVPLTAITAYTRKLRRKVEDIAESLLAFTTEHLFQRYLDHPTTDAEAAEAAALVRRLRPLAQQTLDAELARALRAKATGHLRRHLAEEPATRRGLGEEERSRPPAVALPERTAAAVRELVGEQGAAEFVAAAVEREVQARRMDALTDRYRG